MCVITPGFCLEIQLPTNLELLSSDPEHAGGQRDAASVRDGQVSGDFDGNGRRNDIESEIQAASALRSAAHVEAERVGKLASLRVLVSNEFGVDINLRERSDPAAVGHGQAPVPRSISHCVPHVCRFPPRTRHLRNRIVSARLAVEKKLHCVSKAILYE